MADDLDKMLDVSSSRIEGHRGDKLELLRRKIAEMRDLDREIESIGERLKEKNKLKNNLVFTELPNMFLEAGVDRVDLAASGNLPAYEATMSDYFHANIAADWEPQRRDAAHGWLERRRAGDLIKNQITITFGLEQNKIYRSVVAALKKMKIFKLCSVEVSRGVPWNTLTSWLREHYESERELTKEELETIGATVGKVVKLKPKREKS